MITLAKLKRLANCRQQQIYNIALRNAGWGIHWHDERLVSVGTRLRLEELSKEDTKQDGFHDFLQRYSKLRAQAHSEGIVIYQYYPTFQKMLNNEYKRIKGEQHHD